MDVVDRIVELVGDSSRECAERRDFARLEEVLLVRFQLARHPVERPDEAGNLVRVDAFVGGRKAAIRNLVFFLLVSGKPSAVLL